MKIVVLTDEVDHKGGWHGTQLAAAFKARAIEAVFVSLQDCLIDLSGEFFDVKSIINMPNMSELPKAVFVRGIAGGTLQQITTRLNILHLLKAMGVLVYNEGKAIERTVDKAMTSFMLHQAAIATPKTWVCESRAIVHQIIVHQTIAQNAQLVIKPLFGSQGRGVRLVENKPEKMPLPMDEHVNGVFYLQQFIAATHDYRVLIVNNQAVAAMRRTGATWLHNVAQGASCKKTEELEVLELAIKAAKALDITYCGVDLIKDKNGKIFVLEVNSIPAWRGLQSVTDMNIAQVLVDDFLSKLNDLN